MGSMRRRGSFGACALMAVLLGSFHCSLDRMGTAAFEKSDGGVISGHDASVDGAWDGKVEASGPADAAIDDVAVGFDAQPPPDAPLDVLGEAPSGDVGTDRPVEPPPKPDGGLLAGDGRLYHAVTSANDLQAQSWRLLPPGWAPEATVPPISKTVKWVVAAISPVLDEQILGVMSKVGNECHLAVYSSSQGGTWSEDWRFEGIPGDHCNQRGFDLAYEQISGDALVVYTTGNRAPAYRVRSMGGWSGGETLPLDHDEFPDVNDSPVRWIELEPRYGTDEIGLAYVDGASNLVAILWEGDAWAAETAGRLEDDVKQNPTTGRVSLRAFDLAFEETSGDLMVAWGRQGQWGFVWRRLPHGGDTWSGADVVGAPELGISDFVDLASEPGSERIAGGFFDTGDGTERLGLATWDGSSWQNAGEYDSQTKDVNDTAIGAFHGAVGWVGTSGVALCVYPDDTSDKLDWFRWAQGDGWSFQPDVNAPGKGFSSSMLLHGFRSWHGALTVLSNDDGKLFGFLYDGTSWQQIPGGALASGLSSSDSVPFWLAVHDP